ncbi:MAG: ArnT family glycosyltransferase [Geobacteraceae bacterium]
MSSTFFSRNQFLIALLLYGFLVIAATLNFNSPYHDEALNILMGRQILAQESVPGAAQNTGSVAIQPVLVAAGDSFGGIWGARAVGIFFGLALTTTIYFSALTLLPRIQALFAAILFLLSGTTMYLSKLATYDIVAAFFLGLSFLCVLRSEQSEKYRGTLLLTGSAALFLATITKYVVAVYAPPLLLCALFSKRRLLIVSNFIIPFLVLAGLYVWLALYPVADVLLGSMRSVYTETQISKLQLASWAFRWVAMPYLLAVFGFFHKEYGKTALTLALLSTPVLLFHLLTGAEQSVNKNVIFALVFLAPAAAIGIDHLGNIFSFNASSSWVKPFFTFTLFMVVWAFGLSQLQWLQRQYPDLDPVIEYFQKNGRDGMSVVIDSDFGDAVYTYSLENRFPHARFSSISEHDRNQQNALDHLTFPDYIILDDYYTKTPYRVKALTYIREGHYVRAHTYISQMSWGNRQITIYSRRTS